MDGEIVDTENYRGSTEGFGFKEIVMKQLQRVVTNMSQEMREGFWIYSQTGKKNPERMRYIGDSRKELTQSTDVLHDLLMAKFDKEMNDESKKINEKIQAIKEESETKAEYWKKKLTLYRELFQSLCSFLNRIGWLESEDIEE